MCATSVADHGFNFVAGHATQQTGGHGYQRAVFESACGECVRFAFENANFGHADAGLVSKFAHGVHNPSLVGIAGLLDDLHT